MIESGTGSGESSGGQWLDALIGCWRWLTFMLQRQHQDAFDAPHLQQIEAERARTCGIQPLRRVAVGQAQQLLALAQLGPGEGSLPGAARRSGRRWAPVSSPTHHAVGGAQGVGGLLGRVVIVIRWNDHLWADVAGP